jgi:hypothetical protein
MRETAKARIALLQKQLAAAKKSPRPRVTTTPGGAKKYTRCQVSPSGGDAAANLNDKLAAERARLARIKAGKELCLPVFNEFAKPGEFYILNYGELYRVRDGSSCLWDIGSVGTSGGFGAPQPTSGGSRTIVLLKGLKGLDRENPATLPDYGSVWRFAGRVTELGRESALPK